MREENKMITEEENLEAGELTSSLLNQAKRHASHPGTYFGATAAVFFSTSVAVCGSFSYGCAVGYSSAAKSVIKEDLGLSVADYSLFGSMMTLGAMFGAVFSGKIAAFFGRRPTLWFSEIFCIIGWLAIAFAKDARWLDFGRFSVGIGVGFISFVVPVYVAEITPKDIRGALIFSNQLMQNCGLSLVYILGNLVTWQTLALISVIPCGLQLIGLFFIPESPRWLAEQGREKEFEIALQRLRGKDADISAEATDIREITESIKKDSEAGILFLFQRKYAYSLTVGIGLMLLQPLTGNAGFTYYASTIFQKADFPVSIGTTTLAIVMVPKALMGLLLVDKMGRRPLLMLSACGMFLCSFILGLSFCLKDLQDLKEATSILAFIAVLGYITTFAMGIGGLPWIIMSEIFPINVKVSAGSLVTFANWSVSWVITYTFNFMLEWSSSGTFFLFSGICGGTALFSWLLVPETKGRTLEEIQASLAHIVQ